MPICTRVVSKPGYGTFSEAARLGIPIVTITRDDFAESAFLLDGITDDHYHQILSPSEFFQSNWDFLHLQPQPPQKDQVIAPDGNQAIASAVINYFQ